jgi:hypothetical protein
VGPGGERMGMCDTEVLRIAILLKFFIKLLDSDFSAPPVIQMWITFSDYFLNISLGKGNKAWF